MNRKREERKGGERKEFDWGVPSVDVSRRFVRVRRPNQLFPPSFFLFKTNAQNACGALPFGMRAATANG
jgi:hypothetical protein